MLRGGKLVARAAPTRRRIDRRRARRGHGRPARAAAAAERPRRRRRRRAPALVLRRRHGRAATAATPRSTTSTSTCAPASSSASPASPATASASCYEVALGLRPLDAGTVTHRRRSRSQPATRRRRIGRRRRRRARGPGRRRRSCPASTCVEHIALGDLRRFRKGLGIDWTQGAATGSTSSTSATELRMAAARPRRSRRCRAATSSGSCSPGRSAPSATLVVAAYPSRGLDIATTRRTQELLLEQRAAGAGVLLISEDLDELLELSDRIAVSARRASSPAIVDAATDRPLRDRPPHARRRRPASRRRDVDGRRMARWRHDRRRSRRSTTPDRRRRRGPSAPSRCSRHRPLGRRHRRRARDLRRPSCRSRASTRSPPTATCSSRRSRSADSIGEILVEGDAAHPRRRSPSTVPARAGLINVGGEGQLSSAASPPPASCSAIGDALPTARSMLVLMLAGGRDRPARSGPASPALLRLVRRHQRGGHHAAAQLRRARPHARS